MQVSSSNYLDIWQVKNYMTIFCSSKYFKTFIFQFFSNYCLFTDVCKQIGIKFSLQNISIGLLKKLKVFLNWALFIYTWTNMKKGRWETNIFETLLQAGNFCKSYIIYSLKKILMGRYFYFIFIYLYILTSLLE